MYPTVLFTILTSASLASAQGHGSAPSSSGGSEVPGFGSALPGTRHPNPALTKAIIAHAVMFGLAFVIFMPLAGIAIRLQRNATGVAVHATLQLLSLCMAIGGMGLGIWFGRAYHKLHTNHAYIGLFLVASLVLQPLTGLLRNAGPQRAGRTPPAWIHVWYGRAIVLLGAINGVLGIKLAWTSPVKTERGAVIWGVLSGLMFIVYVAVMWFTRNQKRKMVGKTERDQASGSDENLRRKESSSTETMGGPKTETSIV